MTVAPVEVLKEDERVAAEPPTPSKHTVSEGSGPPGRVIFINDRNATHAAMSKLGLSYASNVVRSSKYTLLSFFPKNLMEQFRRVANFYFLIISLLQLATPFSPTNQYSTIGPLALVLMATMIKEAIEDKARHYADKAVNHAIAQVYHTESKLYQPTQWRDIKVGDIVKVHDNESFPADMVLLKSSYEDGTVQVETANLDGETDLKIRACANLKLDVFDASTFPTRTSGELRCEAPNRKLYNFDGVLKINTVDGSWDVPLTIYNVVLRGMKLSHTTFVEGVVVAAGAETKLIQNTKQAPSKFSRLDVIANRCILVIFSVLFIVCCVSTALNVLVSEIINTKCRERYSPEALNVLTWLLQNNVLSSFVTFLILYNNLVPISLYISLELVKWYQAKKIESDPEMRDEVTGKSVQARTSSLNEDVGQIRYLFTDKTGTITKNEMVLKLVSLGNVIYDNIPVRDKRNPMADRRASFSTNENDRITTRLRAFSANVLPYNMLVEQGLIADRSTGSDTLISEILDGEAGLVRGNIAHAFFRCVLLCHTATLTHENGIRASSPDEAALLRGAIEFNCTLTSRTSTTMDITVFGNAESYEILALNEFDSTRKCMSIVVRHLKTTAYGDPLTKADDIYVFCKGADTAMMTPSNTHGITASTTMDSLQSHVHCFASMGLRTLIFGYKRLTLAEFMAWSAAYTKAKTSIVERESKLTECARMMETHLKLVGATGVEDQLQDGVPDCIETLSAAGINIWMLTGDKDETAISIANSCGLLSDQSQLVVLNETTPQGCLYQLTGIRKHLRKQGLWKPDVASREIALVINGDALESLMNETPSRRDDSEANIDEETGLIQSEHQSEATVVDMSSETNARHRTVSSFGTGHAKRSLSAPDQQSSEDNEATLALFMQLVTQCCSVIACRLSPIHKAQIIALIKSGKSSPVTMAVGDGGNDVSMIQEAHIGVGIYGHEGMQAVRSADFAIGQFRFLSRLILVHGRWNYRRVSIVILFSFYKNMALIMTLFMYSFLNVYSGQTMYESYLIVGWNVFYTFFPILVLGIVDEDISAETVLKYPFIFRTNQMGQELNVAKMRVWVGNALWHSLLVFLLGTFLTYFNLGMYSMPESSIFLYGTALYGILVVTVSLKAAMIMQRMRRWTRYHYASIVGGPFLYLIFVLSYSQAYSFLNSTTFSDFYGLANVLLVSKAFWATLFLVAFTSVLADIVSMYIFRMYLPTNQDIIEEIDSCIDNHDAKTLEELEGTSKEMIAHALGDMRRDLGGIPSEHEELCRKLIRLERAISREVGVHRQEVFEIGISSLSQVLLHPITVEFMGEDHEILEASYMKNFVAREGRRIHVLVVLFLSLLPLYAIVEYYWERDQTMYMTRIAMFCGTFLYLVFLHSRFFVQHYQMGILIPMAICGIAFTQAIEYTGLLLITIFTIVLFSVVRVKVVYAIFLAIFNLVYFDLSPHLGFRSNTPSSESTITEIVLFIAFMLFLIGCAAYGSYTLQVSMRTDFVQNHILVHEERRSREILRNLLPEHIMRRMQNGETLISEEEKDVTILFCDIGDFSAMIKRYSPTEIVQLLDRIYSLFDAMCAKHGMRKMETVGKTYLACAGLQGSVKGKEAALRAAGVAQDMMAAISKCKASNGNGLKIRIGIHSGRVISGLVGMKKQQFSLFGDTINTASRMQSTGVSGRIQVSQVTYDYLCHDFRFEPRTVEAKGKGTLTAYLMGKSTTVLGDRAIRGHWETYQETKLDAPRPTHRTSFEMVILEQTRKWIRQLFNRSNRIEVAVSTVEPADLGISTNRERGQTVRAEVKRYIDPWWLMFRDADFELAYRKSRCTVRLNGYSSTLVRGALIAYAAWFEFSHFHLRANKVEPSPWMVPKLKAFVQPVYHPIFIFYTISTVTLVTPNILRWDSEQQSILYSYISMDIIMLMFLVSSGGSLLNKYTTYFNGILIVITTAIYIYAYPRALPDPTKIEMLKIYPVALTYFVALFSTMARRDIEFFERRKYWFQTRAQLETKKADRLLYKMLPQSVVNQLKEGESVCDQHHQVGILFSDIKGFTSIAARADTDKVVHLLDSLFSAFDLLTEKHGVFKMQTIGDAYVIVSGLPYVDMSSSELNHMVEPQIEDVEPHESGLSSMSQKKAPEARLRMSFKQLDSIPPQKHIRSLIHMASDMQKEVAKVLDPNSGEPLQMRIGIHMGSIIGGVIGTSTLRYDMWGPDVLTANEMETNGVPGKILVSRDVKNVAEKCADLRFTYHKNVAFTNIDDMDTYIAELVDEKSKP
ncbi:unnamed protein product [Aphanomyces euteiches]